VVAPLLPIRPGGGASCVHRLRVAVAELGTVH
jgi:hypothetical protein